MEHKTFRNLSIPVLGFGTYTLNYESIKKAIDLGYRHLDTARDYGNEEDVGRAWKNSGKSRDNFFLTTKIWHTKLKPDEVKKETEIALKNLKTDYVDLLLIHWPSSEGVPLEDTLGAFEEVKKEGKTRAVGISNFTADMQRKAMEITGIHTNQVEYHPFLGQDELIKLCKETDISLTSYRPIAKNKISENDLLNDLAKKYNKSPAQITLRWHIQQEPVIAIPRSKDEEHIKQNMEVFDFKLSENEMSEIFKLDKGLRQIDPAFGPW
ncbi:MAG: aldo/keto reductase [Candidatus Cyclobacteriaceae bacterium M2_1C_046]